MIRTNQIMMELCLHNELMINKTVSFAIFSIVVCKAFTLLSNVKYSLHQIAAGGKDLLNTMKCKLAKFLLLLSKLNLCHSTPKCK